MGQENVRGEYFRTKLSGLAVIIFAGTVLIWQLVDSILFKRSFSFFDIFLYMFMILTIMIGGVILYTSYQKEYLADLGKWLDELGKQIRRASWPLEREMLQAVGDRMVELYPDQREWIMYALLPGYMLKDRPKGLREGRFLRVFSPHSVEQVEEIDHYLRDQLTENAASIQEGSIDIQQKEQGEIAVFLSCSHGIGLGLAIAIPPGNFWKGGNWRKQQNINFIRKAFDQLMQRLTLLQVEWNEFQKTIDDEELGMIVRMLSHEIAGTLSLLLGCRTLKAREEKALARTVHLVRQLQEVPSLRTGFFSVDPGSILLLQMVNEVISSVQEAWKDRDFVVSWQVEDTLKVFGDRNLYSVLQNAIFNALSFSEKKILIEVEQGIRKDHVLVMVTDDGPGVPLDKKDWIFEPLIAEGTDYRPRGKGVGLYIARRIAREVSGDVYLGQPDDGKDVSNQFVIQLLIADPE